jgi:hypothetical protein
MSQEAISSYLKRMRKLDWYAIYSTQVEYKTLRKGKKKGRGVFVKYIRDCGVRRAYVLVRGLRSQQAVTR